jgi:uncharacterized protein YndB with AHSA1/START domain
MTTGATAPRRAVTIERTYKADITDVWALWTTKDGFESWWGPEGFRVDVHKLDARVGGELHYDMIADAPEQVEAMKRMGQPVSHKTQGTFTELRPRERLVLTHVIDFLPGVTPYESTIIAEFFPAGDRVRMVVTLHAMHDETFTRMQVEGFTSQLTKLDKRFGATAG